MTSCHAMSVGKLDLTYIIFVRIMFCLVMLLRF